MGDRSEGAGAILADDRGARQLQLALELAVIGEEQQAFCHEVEAADRHNPREPRRQPIVDGRTALRIVGRGQRALRLVESEEAGRRGRPHRLPVYCHATKIGQQGRRSLQRFAVERDAAFRDHPLDIAP